MNGREEEEDLRLRPRVRLRILSSFNGDDDEEEDEDWIEAVLCHPNFSEFLRFGLWIGAALF